MKINALIFSCALCLLVAAGCRGPKSTATSLPGIKNSNTHMQPTDTFLPQLLSQFPQYFDTLLRNREQYGIQIIYTQIDRNSNNEPQFTHHYYGVDPQRYFYPASTVKLPTAALALQKLNELAIKGLHKNTTMVMGAAYNGQSPVYNDPTTPDGRPTIEHYIKKILLVSDNDAFNRLYEFLGQGYLNNTLHRMGYDSVQLRHRLDIALSEDENRHTNPVTFYDSAANILYAQPLIKSNFVFTPRQQLLGNGYYKGGQLVQAPFDFSAKNRLSLPDLHSILQSIIFPEAVPEHKRFLLTNEDYRFLYKYMSMTPRQSDFPAYDSTYNDAYVKFLLYGGKEPVESSIRIFNKVGDAYGFLIDAAYIIDEEKGVEFLLSAVIHCNSDGIYNDDHYDYETVGFPFMKHLGRVVYDYEVKRIKKVLPHFSPLLLNK